MAGLVLFFGGSLVPLYAMYLRKNVFQVALRENSLVLTTLSPFLSRTNETTIPLGLVHPEPRQGKWLRLIVRDTKYGDRKLRTLYLERAGQFLHYRQLEAIVKTGAQLPAEKSGSAK